MTKEMIVSSNGHETMVAILEDDLVAEIFVERERHRGVVGNVYKGRVSKVLPGMQSSFIDLGLERDGFLYVADVIDTLDEFDKLAGDDEDEAAGAGNGSGGGQKGRPGTRPPGPADAEDRRAPQGRPGNRRPGRQGAARHQGRAADLARDDAGAVSGVHADGGSHRRVAQDRVARGARPAARHRPRVPRGERLHRRRHHPHRRRRAAEGRHPRRPRGLPQDLDRDAPAQRVVARAGRPVSGAEHRRPAAARSADRGLPGDPHRQRAGVPARPRADRADHAEPGAEGEALREALSDLRRVRRAGGDRQGAEEQGLAEVGRLDRHQPDRSAGRDRRQYRTVRRQEDERAGSKTRSSRRTSRR